MKQLILILFLIFFSSCAKQDPAPVFFEGKQFEFKKNKIAYQEEIEDFSQPILDISFSNNFEYKTYEDYLIEDSNDISHETQTSKLNLAEKINQEFKKDAILTGDDVKQEIEKINIPQKINSVAKISNKEEVQVKPKKEEIIKDKSLNKFILPVDDIKIVKDSSNLATFELNKDTDIKAVASGKVLYVGSDLKKYGNMIIISHQNGWVSTYAGFTQMNVKNDQLVNSGDVIGSIKKQTKDKNKKSTLVFSIRKDGKVVDPTTIY